MAPLSFRRTIHAGRTCALFVSLTALCACGMGSAPGPVACPEPVQVCPPAPQCPPPAEPKVVKVPARCPRCASAPKQAGVRVAPSTCVTGEVHTAGDMVFVVQRAKVTVLRETAALGSTWSDNKGRYVWCGATGTVGSGRKITILVEKAPFRPAKKDIAWAKGQHATANFLLEAEGLTTPVE